MHYWDVDCIIKYMSCPSQKPRSASSSAAKNANTGLLSVESIMNDIDVRSLPMSDQLELLINVLVWIEPDIHHAITNSGLVPDQTELVGGTTHVPALNAKQP